ncbi:hypothetical protein [Ilyobacter polytropus]|uniref:SHOCT domain-containing protein n=1 Tax=Ilyobacter polytropus (strain ATCC 51220 / DSM 2926 / LMG 16218 / CuHBu1) TaxID=572544 RepID=E3HBS7_ILYPC|nr:hypothetical protein [Ilyobacter polytropus]ADO83839.1 hypothetical protein Ilyop_2069 [Ilyobacter polytropus DSM 2926]
MLFLIWLAFSFFVAKLATDRGRGFGAWLLLSILLSPLLMIIVLFCKEDLVKEEIKQKQTKAEAEERKKKFLEKIRLEELEIAQEKEKEEEALKPLKERKRYKYLNYKKESGTLTQEEFIELEQIMSQ